jgi:FPC/CPF motif-containing protein YcgG
MKQTILNPFASSAGRENSNYTRWSGVELLDAGGGLPNRMTRDVHAALRAVLHDPDFPCVGAKSIVNQSSYRFGLYNEMASPAATAGLAHDLYLFTEERAQIEGDFKSFIASFVEPKLRSMKQFEALLWRQLQELHELNREAFAWHSDVSSDPQDPRFSFSFAGGAYFVVGLSPASDRWARRFPWPTLVFNDHFQFERLREEQKFDRMRDTIRERDESLHGSVNPMMSDHGKHSEARQYSGRNVGEGWRCPVQFEGGQPP